MTNEKSDHREQFPIEAGLLVKILVGVLVGIPLATVPLMLAHKWFPSTLLVLTEGMLFFALMAARRNNARVAAWTILISLGICLFLLIATGKGPLDEGVLVLPALMIFASLFGSPRLYFALLGAIAALLAGLAMAHFSDWRPIPNVRISPDTFITVAVVLGLTSYFVWLMASALRNALRSLIQENRRVAHSLRQIEQLVHHDPLTGLPNRSLGRDRFEQAMAQATRNKSGVALLYVDLDNFKTVNDSLGHAAGDALLHGVAGRLLATVRAKDTVCRQGGDEFLIILNEVADPDTIATIADKIVAALTPDFAINGVAVTATCSIGIALFPSNGPDFETVLKRADLAMYQAKEAGRNMFQFFDEQMNTHAAANLHLIAAMRQGMARGDFRLEYQPQFSLSEQRVVGAEAMMRWTDPEFGAVPPARFIPLAERSGLIVPLGAWALGEACRQAKAWQDAGLKDLVVAVNVSPVQLRRSGVVDQLRGELLKTGVASNHIELEITESLLLGDSKPLVALLSQLRELGVHLSIDDFGTGYSNLSYLKKFDVQRLKIDQSFVRRMKHDEHDAGIVRAVVLIANSLKLEAVAEGIEDQETLDQLVELGCSYGQGYYWSPALPPDEFLLFVKGRQ